MSSSNLIPARQPRKGEVASFKSTDGKMVIAITTKGAGAFHAFKSSLRFEDEEGVYYWSNEHSPIGGMYGSVRLAKSDLESIFGTLEPEN
ncbi:hypothetical protein [Hyphomonas sp.]|uniref:hypothetical protein n=1 Tax=Hyphomonas sp. TaxID=87 RepID=UPI00352725B4